VRAPISLRKRMRGQTTKRVLLRTSDLVRDDKRRPIPAVAASQETIGLFIADDLFGVGIHA